MTAPHNRQTKMDLTPTWAGLMPAFIALLKHPDADADATKEIEQELMKFAQILDDVVIKIKAGQL